MGHPDDDADGSTQATNTKASAFVDDDLDPDTNGRWDWLGNEGRPGLHKPPFCHYATRCELAKRGQCRCQHVSDAHYPCEGAFQHKATGHVYCFHCAYYASNQAGSLY